MKNGGFRGTPISGTLRWTYLFAESEALENCENGPETVTEKGCSLDCPLLQIEGATAHPEFFGILR